jgi:hypothetical protein
MINKIIINHNKNKMYFAIYYSCNQSTPEIFGIGKTEKDIDTLIINNIGDDKNYKIFTEQLDDEENNIPYEVSDVSYEHIKTLVITYQQAQNIFKGYRLGLDHVKCKHMISIFKSDTSNINFAKIINSVQLS